MRKVINGKKYDASTAKLIATNEDGNGKRDYRTIEKGQLVVILKELIEEAYKFSDDFEKLVFAVSPDDYDELYEFYDSEYNMVNYNTNYEIKQCLFSDLEEDGIEKFIEYFGEEKVEKVALAYMAKR